MPTSCRLLVLCALAFSVTAVAQAPSTEWHSVSLNLRFNYPGNFNTADASQVLKDGHLTLLGINGESDPQLAAETRCLRPNLLLQLAPTSTSKKSGTILLAELDVDCLTPQQQAMSKDLLANMAEVVGKVPGMTSIAQPAWYNVGWQKVHMAAAQGMPPGSGPTPDGETPAQVFTMGLSTNWNNHLLVWYFSSNSTDLLNQMTKSTVRFGRSAAAPLYASTIGNSSNSAQ